MLVDSHCHLDYPGLAEDLDGVVARAGAAGVQRMLTICVKLSEFERVHAVAKRFDNVWCTVGVHPHEADSETGVTAQRIVEATQAPEVVGIGETGLDYFYDNAPRDEQRTCFLAHIDAARQTQLPLIIHARDADDDMAEILEAEHAKGAFPFLLHCFSSGPELAQRAVAIGGYVSLSGIITFKKADDIRETVKALPLERLLVETDAPYLAPVPHRGKTNEPAFTAHTAARLAEIKGVTPDEIAQVTTDNFHRLFTKVPAPDTAAHG
ncbi:TatD family hydrolase [Pyruvatibacter sp.]|uniref:TatD family hydrolase n=1 Tax=Pyruvatibacter sp. TaxID=1981328 RepID=UPI0032ED7B3B